MRFGEIHRSGVTGNKFDVLVFHGAEIRYPTGLLVDVSNYGWGSVKYRATINATRMSMLPSISSVSCMRLRGEDDNSRPIPAIWHIEMQISPMP